MTIKTRMLAAWQRLSVHWAGLMRTWAWWLIESYPDALDDRTQAWRLLRDRHPASDEIDAALVASFADCGLNQDAYSLDFDLLHSGKLHEVLVHASARLGNPLVTVTDVRELLK